MKSAAPVPLPAPQSSEILMKGNKGATTQGDQTTIVDFARQEVTVVDGSRKKYATIPASQYREKIAEAMPQAGMPGVAPGSIKSKVESKKTGRGETILGVQTEETETTLSMEIAIPQATQAMTMRMVMQTWNATPGETLRVPAIHQLMGFHLWQDYFMSDAKTIGRMLPGAGEALGEAMKSQSAALRTVMKMYMSMPGMVGNAPGDTPFMEMTTEIVELSVEPVDDAVFQVPEGYSAVGFSELMNGRREDAAQAMKARPSSAPGPVSGDVQAYVPDLMPLTQSEPKLPEEARAAGVQGMVELIVTLDAKGKVTKAEALSGPDLLRKAAASEVMSWTYRPVIRKGVAVPAYTDAMVTYFDRSSGMPPMPDMEGAATRKRELEQALPRTPDQVLADLEQDSQGGDQTRRFYALNRMTEAALSVGADAKAEQYARELIGKAAEFPKDWNYGNAIYDGHTTLGLLAMKKNDIATASKELVEAGKTPGSPQLDSFGPKMNLAKDLLEKGERNTVLEYFSLCRNFWKMGASQLDAWTASVNQGEMPAFGMNLR